jgi:hypothetical protein
MGIPPKHLAEFSTKVGWRAAKLEALKAVNRNESSINGSQEKTLIFSFEK